jgi:hypothetical protein
MEGGCYNYFGDTVSPVGQDFCQQKHRRTNECRFKVNFFLKNFMVYKIIEPYEILAGCWCIDLDCYRNECDGWLHQVRK